MRYFAKPGVAIAFGAFMLCAGPGPLAQDATLTRRQYQAVAWAFMLSLLFGALLSFVQEWLTPPNIVEWGLSEGAFVGIILALTVIALCGLVSTVRTVDSSAP